jgi:hypothetical protein
VSQEHLGSKKLSQEIYLQELQDRIICSQLRVNLFTDYFEAVSAGKSLNLTSHRNAYLKNSHLLIREHDYQFALSKLSENEQIIRENFYENKVKQLFRKDLEIADKYHKGDVKILYGFFGRYSRRATLADLIILEYTSLTKLLKENERSYIPDIFIRAFN